MRRARGLEVVIVSTDKDMMQLVSPEIRMVDTMKEKTYDIEAVKERWYELQVDIPEPAFAAGHSMGQYTALVAAGALALDDAVRLVVFSGEGTKSFVSGADISQFAKDVKEGEKVKTILLVTVSFACGLAIALAGPFAPVSWNRARRAVLGSIAPAHVNVPASGASRPASRLSSVDFPQPEGPSTQTNSPSSMVKFTSCRT